MRTKTLLLTAAVTAAGVATSMAQVYSVNAVGYVNKSIPAGKLELISNPLDAGAGNNTIGKLFKGAPAGTQVFKFKADGTGFETPATYDDIDNAFLPESSANLTVVPGEGVFVSNPTGQPVQYTFVGEVPQGQLSNPVPAGLSIRSSQVPQRDDVVKLGFPSAPGDQIFKWASAKAGYDVFGFDDIDNAWLPSAPILEVGEAVFVRKNAAATWTRTFSVNTP
jgi:hypothetical protein